MAKSNTYMVKNRCRAMLQIVGLAMAFFCLMPPVFAAGLDSLDAFLKNTKTGRANFTQTQSAPPKDGSTVRVKISSGAFEFARPHRFKFTYLKPFAQTIVADGQTLWMYDPELAQVTTRNQAQVLGSTPAALITSGSNLQSLAVDYTLSNDPPTGGLDWVLAVPKNRETSIQQLRVGFKSGTLAVLEIHDSLGQRSVLQFSNVETNFPLDAAAYHFKPPAGVDVLKQ